MVRFGNLITRKTAEQGEGKIGLMRTVTQLEINPRVRRRTMIFHALRDLIIHSC